MVNNEKATEKNAYMVWSKGKLVEKIEELEKRIQKLKEMEVNLIEKNEFLKEISMRDYLTKIYNHRAIMDIIEKRIDCFNHKGEVFSILMIDIDDFKSVNDHFGHVFGDEVIIRICKEIKRNIRKNDYVGRYGGEEFIVIFNNTKLEETVMISERIRKSIEKLEPVISLNITISGGVREYSNGDCKKVVEDADKFLYKAKSLGKNRICY